MAEMHAAVQSRAGDASGSKADQHPSESSCRITSFSVAKLSRHRPGQKSLVPPWLIWRMGHLRFVEPPRAKKPPFESIPTPTGERPKLNGPFRFGVDDFDISFFVLKIAKGAC